MLTSLLKAIDILEAFTPSRPVLSLADLSTRLGYPKTTIYTILSTLESRGYIEKNETGLYSLGISFIPLSQSVRVNSEIRDRAAPVLRDLGNYTGESVYLAIHDGNSCLYIYAIESSDRLLARSAIGERAPMHCTAVGKAMLAYLREPEVQAVIDETGLPASTAHTITTEKALKTELEAIRKTGMSTDREEHEERTFCIACPIFDRMGNVIAACSVSGSDPEILKGRKTAISNCVRYSAQSVSRLMGYIPKADHMIWKQAANPMK